ncbi:hypothetical protein [Paraburkholderia saeva]|uniref:Uncharacterized protein n=1 Tax=Paraburkholderia saeva TaxID=2777537 RepID=A0A9N8X1J6_9BURK|nr:hypothetical protein [Paraburkholderia saeva]CAG4900916.1 hypothetical protein LMG31841_02932 [Paraburkholderia saeva]
MKRLLSIALLALSSIAFGATLNPIQLLNPAGSTSGQAIVSTGASSAPAWGGIAVSSLTGLGTGVGTALGATVTGSGGIVLGTAPTITTPNITGVATNSNAAAGSVGEFVTATGTAVPLTGSVAATITSISLTAGDWDVSGNIYYTPAGTTVVSQTAGGINTTAATLPAIPFYTLSPSVNNVAGNAPSAVTPTTRISIASTTTVYLVGFAAFSVSTCTATGYIAARRRR